MERDREGRIDSSHLGGPFDSFGGFGFHRSLMSSIFGGRDPFDDPFFTHPFGSMSGSNMFGSSSPFGDSPGDSPQISRSKGPVIEEIHTDDDEGGDDAKGAGEKKDKGQKNPDSSKDPLVEHPDDQAVDEREDKVAPCKTDYNKREGMQPQNRSASFRKVTYGGINGAYYTASTMRRTGSDGLLLEESRQADRTTGQATHRISRGIHDKGHSVTRKLNSDGKVDTMQKLHNLSEDELTGFEQAWKGNAEGHLPSWNDEFNFQGNAGASGSGQSRRWGGWALPLGERSGTGRAAGGMRPDNESTTYSTYSSGGRPKKVVTINIE